MMLVSYMLQDHGSVLCHELIATTHYLIHTCISLREASEFSFFNSSCRIECSSSLTSSKSLDIKKEFKKIIELNSVMSIIKYRHSGSTRQNLN